MLSPPSSKKLSSTPTRASPSTSANSPHSIASCGVARRTLQNARRKLRRRQRTPVELAVRRQRQTLQHHNRRRHHVLRQSSRQRSPKQSRLRHRSPRRRRPHSRPAARLPGPVLARHHNRLRHARLPQQHSLDLARLDPEPAQLDLRVRPPQKLQHTVGTPPRQVPGPVHPRTRPAPAGAPCGSATNRSAVSPARLQIAPRQTNARNVQARPQHPQELAQDQRPEHRPDNSADGRPIGDVQRRRSSSHSMAVASIVVSVGP